MNQMIGVIMITCLGFSIFIGQVSAYIFEMLRENEDNPHTQPQELDNLSST